MQIRRDLHLRLWLAFLVFCLAESSSAAPGQVLFSPPSLIAASYDTFEVDIAVDAGVRGFGCYNVQVDFLRPNVRVLEVLEGPLFKNAVGEFGWTAKDTTGIWDIFDCVLAPHYVNGPGVLATIKFATGASPCNTPLHFTYVYFQDVDGVPFTVGSADGIIVVPGCCDCSHQGDINSDGVIDVFDVIGLIEIAFSGGSDIQDPGCPTSRSDVNNDGAADVFDVIYIIGTAFSGGASPIDPCSTGGR